MKEAGTDELDILRAFHLEGVRDITVLGTMGASSDLVAKKIKQAGKAFKENTALQKEFSIQATSLNNKFVILMNNLRKFAKVSTIALQPFLEFAGGVFIAIIRSLTWLITTFPRFTRLVLLSIAALVGIKVALMASALAMKIYVAALAIGRTAMLLFNAAMFANPLGMLIGLMFVATAAFYGFRDAIGEAIESLVGLFGASMPAWLRSIFGMGEKIITVKHVLDGKESPIGAKNGKEGGVAVNTPGSTSTLNGTINVNAPPGVVNSVSSTVKGAGGNLGVSMAGAG